MKSTFVYYLFIILPLIVLIAGVKTGVLSNEIFAVLLLTYAFVYRTIIGTLRLQAKGVVNNKNFNAILFPFSRAKYFRALYLP